MNNAVLELFNDRLPHKPYFSDDLHFGVRIAGKERAILAKYIQFNQPHAMFWLGFDVDRTGAAIDWSDRNAPAPTLTITNPENGHAHLLYALETSIRTAPDGKMKPLRYAAAVENALRKKLEADAGYSGLICKNPNHGHWKIAVWQPELYTLDWLADSLDLNAANDKEIVSDYGLGRNCTLFDKTRKWAYRAIRQGWPEFEQWLKACYERASAYNLQFSAPLDEKEIHGIAKSIAKWTFINLTESSFNDFVRVTHTSDVQTLRGIASGKSRRAGSLEEKSPWISMGISRRKYFYDKKKKLSST
ncbi:TPA: replication initiation protein [Salmonella enterica subsp. enterica serovar Montevideo]|uniref:replication initiation protein n=2 Tax=Klebsiella pneumoniae TaxID=573 RepID=UPI001D0A64A8|nr:replication initiation protein [Klebsiella pneumoniae]HEB2824866.1 replication initiation protein [Salmonella enterica subsp. enterica serovar Montevideo]MCB8062104.1 replication initiation protein [Klebsiella pneumoniae]HBV4277788.1 replicase [Klebsiella pneumoniae]HBV4306057.1 replicase [Klebsiella pneumoniae]HEB2900289.1 replication initiation protein [Salmonella enterica subsp. enterica serovar Montevideo]